MNHADQRRLQETLDGRMRLGTALGLLAGICFNIALDCSGGSALFTTLLCGTSGAILGLLLWLGSAELPEDVIPPVKAHATASENADTQRRRDKKA